jgi:hypothetical protein
MLVRKFPQGGIEAVSESPFSPRFQPWVRRCGRCHRNRFNGFAALLFGLCINHLE